ncbi:MAG: hypothetical protein QM764_21815 [Chitinophagaceae bacterium]
MPARENKTKNRLTPVPAVSFAKSLAGDRKNKYGPICSDVRKQEDGRNTALNYPAQ